MRLSKDQILARRSLPREVVEVPEWEGSVIIQGLSAWDGDKFLASLQRQHGQRVERDTSNYCAKLLALCLIDDAGKLLLDDADALALGQQHSAVVMRLASIAQRLSGFEAAGVEDAAKN